MAYPIAKLVQKGWVWQGREALQQQAPENFLSTGWSVLDQHLGGGWLKASVNELQVQQWHIGELTLLLPTLMAAQQSSIWINPPVDPYWPGLLHQQLQHPPVVIRETDPKLALWATEQALQTRTGPVLAWLASPPSAAVRRLQQAAEQHQQLGFVLTNWQAEIEARAYVNRLQLQWADDQLHIGVVKRRFGWPLAPFPCPVTERLPERRRLRA